MPLAPMTHREKVPGGAIGVMYPLLSPLIVPKKWRRAYPMLARRATTGPPNARNGPTSEGITPPTSPEMLLGDQMG